MEHKMKKFSLSIAVYPGRFISFSLSARDDIPQVIPDRLHLLADTRLRLVYADPDADLGAYSKLLMIYPQVA